MNGIAQKTRNRVFQDGAGWGWAFHRACAGALISTPDRSGGARISLTRNRRKFGIFASQGPEIENFELNKPSASEILIILRLWRWWWMGIIGGC